MPATQLQGASPSLHPSPGTVTGNPQDKREEPQLPLAFWPCLDLGVLGNQAMNTEDVKGDTDLRVSTLHTHTMSNVVLR